MAKIPPGRSLFRVSPRNANYPRDAGSSTRRGQVIAATTILAACSPGAAPQDDWLAGLLGGVALTLVGDTLTLSDGTITLTLLDREVATPDQPLEGTHWVLDGILSGDAVSSVPA